MACLCIHLKSGVVITLLTITCGGAAGAADTSTSRGDHRSRTMTATNHQATLKLRHAWAATLALQRGCLSGGTAAANRRPTPGAMMMVVTDGTLWQALRMVTMVVMMLVPHAETVMRGHVRVCPSGSTPTPFKAAALARKRSRPRAAVHY